MSAKKETKEKTPAQKAAETRKRNAAKKLASQNEPEMVSYGMKMTIPTGQYANIQPEIVVKAGSPEEAHKYIAPHMNKLWKEYFMISERKTDVAKAPVTKAPVTKAPVKAEKKDPVEDAKYLFNEDILLLYSKDFASLILAFCFTTTDDAFSSS